MKKLIWIVLASFFFILTGCHQQLKGNGNQQTATRNISTFKNVRILGNYQVNIKVGQPPQVSITADQNLIPYVVTHVHGRTLDITTKSGYSLLFSQTPVINVTTDNLANINLIGSGTVTASDIKADDFDLKVVGSGTATLSGIANDLNISVMGAGNVVANNLIAKDVEVRSAGSGNVEVFANNTLDIKVSGSGKVQYHGNPNKIEQKIAGTGLITGTSSNAKTN